MPMPMQDQAQNNPAKPIEQCADVDTVDHGMLPGGSRPAFRNAMPARN